MRLHTLTEFSTIFFKKENALHLSLVFPFFIWVLLGFTEIILHFTMIPGIFASVNMPLSLKLAAIFNNLFFSLLVLIIIGFPQYIIFYGFLRLLKSFRTVKKVIKILSTIAFSFFIMFEGIGWVYFSQMGRFPSLGSFSSWFASPAESIDMALNSNPVFVVYIPLLGIILAGLLIYTLNRGILLRPGASFKSTIIAMPVILVLLGVTSSIMYTSAKTRLPKAETSIKKFEKAKYYIERKTSPILSLKADYFNKSSSKIRKTKESFEK